MLEKTFTHLDTFVKSGFFPEAFLKMHFHVAITISQEWNCKNTQVNEFLNNMSLGEITDSYHILQFFISVFRLLKHKSLSSPMNSWTVHKPRSIIVIVSEIFFWKRNISIFASFMTKSNGWKDVWIPNQCWQTLVSILVWFIVNSDKLFLPFFYFPYPSSLFCTITVYLYPILIIHYYFVLFTFLLLSSSH